MRYLFTLALLGLTGCWNHTWRHGPFAPHHVTHWDFIECPDPPPLKPEVYVGSTPCRWKAGTPEKYRRGEY